MLVVALLLIIAFLVIKPMKFGGLDVFKVGLIVLVAIVFLEGGKFLIRGLFWGRYLIPLLLIIAVLVMLGNWMRRKPNA
jgi:hypothetical protein